MEPELVEDDFQRFRKENEVKWRMIDESLEKCMEIDGKGESVSFQVSYSITIKRGKQQGTGFNQINYSSQQTLNMSIGRCLIGISIK